MSTDRTPPGAHREIEIAILSRVMFGGRASLQALREAGLLPEHFTWAQYGEVYTLLSNLSARDAIPLDEKILALKFAELPSVLNAAQAEAIANEISVNDSMPGVEADYVEVIRDDWRRRNTFAAATLLAESATRGDDEQRAAAISMLSAPDGRTPGRSPKQLADDWVRMQSEPPPPRFALPWDDANRRLRGGLARGHIMFLSGWSGHGKTVIYLQILGAWAKGGLRAHSYINEMSAEEHIDRTIARMARVPYGHIDSRMYQGTKDATRRVLDAAKLFSTEGFGITDCAGWSAEEIAHDIVVNRWDAVGLDILHEIPHEGERELSKNFSKITGAIRQIKAAGLVTGHLNDARVTGAVHPVPVARDVRGSGMIWRGGDVVIYVHRHENDDGVPGYEGIIKIDKLRAGAVGSFAVEYNPAYMEFLTVDERYGAAA